MLSINLNNAQLMDNWTESDPNQRCRATFPLFGQLGTENTSAVYFELDEGNHLGTHTDSGEETLVILEGTVEAVIGEKRATLPAGSIAVVPAMEPHDVRNVGTGTARVLGVFSSPRLVATFENTWQPGGSNTIDTDQIAAMAEV